jgi:hypothetical protein
MFDPAIKAIASQPTPEAPDSGQMAWRGMLWAEWFAHSQLLLIFLAVWLVAVWTLPLFANPGWILLLGALYALLAGPLYGGGDVLEGCEEFTFALPPTRWERYWSRFLVGGGSLLVLCGMNVVALGLDLPQVLARLYIETGIIAQVPTYKPGLLYGLVVVLPFTVFVFAFVVASVTHSRLLILLSWFWAALGALALLQIGFWYEDLVWDALNGYFACPLLFVASTVVLIIGHFCFSRKEVGKPSMPLTLPGHWWLWMVLFALGLALAIALLTSLAQHFPRFLNP